MKLILFLLLPLTLHAEYLIGFGTGACMGRSQLQGEWISENKIHHVLGIFGDTQDKNIGNIKQFGIAYLWNFGQKEFDNFKWTPLQAGAFLTYTDHKKFYLKSPSRYNDPDYYDTTNVRWGLRFSTELMLIRKSEKTIRILLDGNLLEQALIAFANNPSELEVFQAFWGLGISVRFDF